jgi:hypothetical protein
VLNNITVTTIAGVELDAVALQIGDDRDSFSLSFSASFAGSASVSAIVNAVAPLVLVVTVNSEIFHFVVDQWSRDRSFPDDQVISVIGGSYTKLLGAPYYLPTSKIFDTALTFSQVIQSFLPIDNSFTFNTDVDWLIPANTISVQNKTPIQAINELAQSAGLFVQPAKAAMSFEIKKIYNVLPWNFATTAPDFVLNEDAIFNESRQKQPTQQGDAVYISSGHVFVFAKITAEAGLKLLPNAQADIVTDLVSARVLAERLISAQQEQPEITRLSTIFNPSAGLPYLPVGRLIQVGTVRGIVSSASISANEQTDIVQTVTLGESTQSVYSRFIQLIPTEFVQVGTVIAVENARPIVQLPEGARVVAQGEGQIGQRVYIKGKEIIGIAPSLALSLLDI